MTVITRTVNSIIEDAYKLIGMFSEDLPLAGGRITEGLNTLQLIADEFASKPIKIAWDSTITFNTVVDQREYIFSKAAGADVDSHRLVSLKYITVQDGDFEYPVEIQPDEYFFNRNISKTRISRPQQVYLQNFLDTATDSEGSKLVFFTKPDKIYTVTVKAKFVLDVLTLNQPLDQVPRYYHRFMIYALARALHDKFPGSVLSANAQATYLQLLDNINSATDIDTVADTGSALKGNRRGLTKSRFLNGC